MPSRRRTANKNLANNLAEVQRRLRTLERRPVRSKLGNRSVTGAAIGPNSVDGTQVSFGINLVTSVDQVTGAVIPPTNILDGTTRTDPNTGLTETWSESLQAWIKTTDPSAQFDADMAALLATQAAESATQAASDASDAMTSANGKNTVFRQSSTPTAKANGDIWFDTSAILNDSTGSRPKRWNATTSQWEAFGLSYAAITSLDADTIVAGTITGRTLQTSANGNRIVVSNSDDIVFWKDDTTIVGVITPIIAGWVGNKYSFTGGVQMVGSLPDTQGGEAYPAVVAAGDADAGVPGAYLIGSADSELGVYDIGFYYSGPTGSIASISSDIISILSGYGTPGDQYIELYGPLVLGNNTDEGPLMQGSGIPTKAGNTFGQVVFRYT
jgi:hypothetical protein